MQGGIGAQVEGLCWIWWSRRGLAACCPVDGREVWRWLWRRRWGRGCVLRTGGGSCHGWVESPLGQGFKLYNILSTKARYIGKWRENRKMVGMGWIVEGSRAGFYNFPRRPGSHILQAGTRQCLFCLNVTNGRFLWRKWILSCRWIAECFFFLFFRIFDAFSFCFHFSVDVHVAFVDFPPSPDCHI